jgi:flagellar basal body P-ring protein FlgI
MSRLKIEDATGNIKKRSIRGLSPNYALSVRFTFAKLLSGATVLREIKKKMEEENYMSIWMFKRKFTLFSTHSFPP